MPLEYLGESAAGYTLYRNKDGFIDAYKKKGSRKVNNENIGTGLEHVATNCTSVQEFEELFSANKKPTKLTDKPPELF